MQRNRMHPTRAHGRRRMSGLAASLAAIAAAAIVVVSSPTAAMADSVVGAVAGVPNTANSDTSAVSPDGSRVYVSGGPAGTVTVIDTATRSVIGTVSMPGINAAGVAVSPDGTKLYVAQSTTDTVAVIDTASLAVVAVIPVEDSPYAIELAPDGTELYVTHLNAPGTRAIAVIDLATDTAVATIATPRSPRGLTFSPDGSRAYVSHFSPTSFDVDVIDTATRSVIGSIPLASRTERFEGMAVTPDGSMLYGASLGSDSVKVVDTATNTVIASIPVGDNPAGVAITPEGRRAYVANTYSNSISVIDTATNAVVSTIAVTGNPQTISISPDGLFAYVAGTGSVFSVISLDTFPAITTTDLLDGTEGTAYTGAIVTAGSPAPTVAVSDGTFPPGLVLDPVSGEITGIPTAPGTYTFTVTASSTVSGIASTATEDYTIVIDPAPVAPSAALDLEAIPTDAAIDLSWRAPVSDGGSPITGYRIERSADGESFVVLVADTESTETTYTDEAVTPGVAYTYRVIALNAVGAGPVSNEDDAELTQEPGDGEEPAADGESTAEDTRPDSRQLAETGSDDTVFAGAAGVALVVLLVGGCLIALSRRARTR